MKMMSNNDELAFLMDSRTQELIKITSFATSLGRASGNGITLPHDHLVSRQHAVILYINGRFFIQDLSSRNGTLLNSRPLDRQCPTLLQTGDQIVIGVTRLTFFDPTGANRKSNRSERDTLPLDQQQINMVAAR